MGELSAASVQTQPETPLDTTYVRQDVESKQRGEDSRSKSTKSDEARKDGDKQQDQPASLGSYLVGVDQLVCNSILTIVDRGLSLMDRK